MNGSSSSSSTTSVHNSSVRLYHLTLESPKSISAMCYGSFSGPKRQEVVVVRGTSHVELLDVSGGGSQQQQQQGNDEEEDDEDVSVRSVRLENAFGIVRSVLSFRLTGGQIDHVVVGSDSGRICILKYENDETGFVKVHQETFGKTGCRRIVPGQLLASDPKGRAIMIAAVEKQKFVYVMNRDASNRLTISSPLSAHKSNTLTFDVKGIDVGFENPTFACLEIDYADLDDGIESVQSVEKMLTYYELDLGLNHVVRKWSEPTDRGANMLIPVPGGNDGPGGVLVCAENRIVYQDRDHDPVSCLIPRRADLPAERGVLIVSYAAHKQKDMFFVLIQSEYGDIYKVTMDVQKKIDVKSLTVQYFDTIPTTRAMAITKTGYLFAASEFSNHYHYQFLGLGDDDDVVRATSADNDASARDGGVAVPVFTPRALTNLGLVDDLESLGPMTDLLVENLAREESPQLFALCGQGPRSSLRTLRHGLDVTEMAVTDLPGNPIAVWTLRLKSEDEHDKYIVVSFSNATLVLSVGETVEEVSDSGLLTTASTLAVSTLDDDTMVQVHSGGVRHVMDGGSRTKEWKTPGGKVIVQATCNSRQCVVAMRGGTIVYFELDDAGQLEEVAQRDVSYDISSLDVATIPPGLARTPFLAVGSYDHSARLLSLDPKNVFGELATQMLMSPVRDVKLSSSASSSMSGAKTKHTLQLYVGLMSGVLVRASIDTRVGKIYDTRKRFLGSKPVKLFEIETKTSGNAVLALSSRSWLCYRHQSRYKMTPVSYGSRLEYAAGFNSTHCAKGVVAISESKLRILSFERLDETFTQTFTPLRYTPRKMCVLKDSSTIVVVQTDHNAYNEAEKQALRNEEEAEKKASEPSRKRRKRSSADETKSEDATATEAQVGSRRPAKSGKWASCVHLINGMTSQPDSILELSENEAALSVCTCVFQDKGGETFVCVGTAKDLIMRPKRSFTCGYVHVYRVIARTNESGGTSRGLSLLHKTKLDKGVPYALCAFKGYLLVGMGNVVRMYGFGKQRLLRKCEKRGLPVMVTSMHTMGDRIYVGDVSSGFVFMKYRHRSNEMVVFADSVVPRFLTRALNLDYDTMMGADKFGNVFGSRVPDNCDDDIVAGESGSDARLWRSGSSANKLETVFNFHCGEVLTSLRKATMVTAGREVVVAGGIMGSIRAFVPLQTREDVDFLLHLEMYMRSESSVLLVGREQLSFRSAFAPASNVIDGDLCEAFVGLSKERKDHIAEEMDRTVSEITRKLESLRNMVL